MNQRPNCSGLDNSGRETTYHASTKRIAKNTLMLYFRQILILLVSLYTVRVVLNTLGAEDYGIYNVVAGVVVLFSFVNNAMATATQRFLNYSLGENDKKKTQEVYSASLIVHLGIAAIFVLLAETVGLWFVSNKLNIPEARRAATAIVYQFTIITTVFNILRVPYNAVIIAYEKMSFFAWLSILESLLKLAIVFLLVLSGIDRLVFYAFLMTAVALIILCFYKLYCNRTFEIARYSKVTDISLVKKILSFSGWSLFGAVANVANSQGTNIVLNMFTNVTVNAAMGIANQVNSAVYSFVGNFQTAFNPQIVKSYAEGKKEYFIDLVFRTAKVSFLLLNFMVVPLLLNAEIVLHIWLKSIPEYTIHFVQLILIWSLIDSWNGPLWMSVQATGNIRKYQIYAVFHDKTDSFPEIQESSGKLQKWIFLYVTADKINGKLLVIYYDTPHGNVHFIMDKSDRYTLLSKSGPYVHSYLPGYRISSLLASCSRPIPEILPECFSG